MGGGVAVSGPQGQQARRTGVYVHRLAAAPGGLRCSPMGWVDLAGYRRLGQGQLPPPEGPLSAAGGVMF